MYKGGTIISYQPIGSASHARIDETKLFPGTTAGRVHYCGAGGNLVVIVLNKKMMWKTTLNPSLCFFNDTMLTVRH